ncbi:MAG: UDP-N-acetylglucosamine 2-epimerase (non-hydrolyzing) [Bacteroidia bacterium]|nr:UDP-N-acetylglucosamine 2-epimerase (non-hydrolyzing) [Bacteroidia bacterium]
MLIVVGTRPNFIKVTQFKKESLRFPDMDVKIVHTGQHYDAKMADVFFKQFNLIPDFFLNITSGSPNNQIAQIIIKLEELVLNTYQPDLIVVVGDVNSTFAAALVANKLSIKLAHLESGLRSHDKTMPEEHNRILTDAVTDYYFITEQSGMDNLKREGKGESQLFFVGNTMIDTMVAYSAEINQSLILSELSVEEKKYVLMTMHRPATVDNENGLKKLITLINALTKKYKVVFPIHPRTLKNAEKMNLLHFFTENKQLVITEPLDYFSFQKLIAKSKFIITDSGGIQEESTFLKVPCLTLRPNTERPITSEIGTNTLVPFEISDINKYIDTIENLTYKKGLIPPFWDGKATHRIVELIANKILK